MKSNKQRSKEIKNKRRDRRRAKIADTLRRKRIEAIGGVDVYTMPDTLPSHAVMADQNELSHNNTYGCLPLFYVDKSFHCRDCGEYGVWKAKQQRWWYEIVKGSIDSRAVQCIQCRKYDQAQREDQKRHMEKMANKEPHPNEAFFKNN